MDEMKENKVIGRKAKILLLQILKQGYITPQQMEDLTAAIDLPLLQVEIIDKTEEVEQVIVRDSRH